ncbi:L10-interacting MYB domain-containing protein-like [Eucalyptus grandis]|uniref:L10-interacting MYB domain-containing protein-like n=1 Tax=Eucalyptus grandis TaxID=71139 RepID=UPI00192EC022|nr:L10-interacting MYB domain-containing protein-like [Eucalyptus grandis]XP_039172116.1 L10-interacting MYB domain-containing protein-like [Eucalyptus grandis]
MASSSKEKAYWSPEDVETFCRLCIEQIEKGNRPASNKRDGWTNIINKFEELRGKKYNKNQMKSKWDNLKEEWKKWKQLVQKETGLGWDPRKKTIDASDEWWERKIQVNSKLRVFRTKGIHPDIEVLLDQMFQGTVVTGSVIGNPAQGLCNNENVETTQADIGDCAGSTDDTLEHDVREINAQPSQSKSHKRTGESSTKEAQAKRGKKLTESDKLASQIDRLCSAIESRSNATSIVREFDPYKEIVQILKAIPEIKQDRKLFFFALSHFAEKKDNRQIFMNLDEDEEKVEWLKYKLEEHNSRH